MTSNTLIKLVELMRLRNEVSGDRLAPPASAADLREVDARALRNLGHPLPSDLLQFLALTDGAYISSLCIGGSRERPIVDLLGREHNSVFIPDVIEMIREHQMNLLNDADLFMFMYNDRMRGWDPVNYCWLLLDRGNGTWPSKVYRSFEEMLADALWEVSIDPRSLMPPDFEFSSLDDTGKKIRGTRAC
jgi:hypothetical protein